MKNIKHLKNKFFLLKFNADCFRISLFVLISSILLSDLFWWNEGRYFFVEPFFNYTSLLKFDSKFKTMNLLNVLELQYHSELEKLQVVRCRNKYAFVN